MLVSALTENEIQQVEPPQICPLQCTGVISVSNFPGFVIFSVPKARDSFQAMDKDLNGEISMEEAQDAFNLW